MKFEQEAKDFARNQIVSEYGKIEGDLKTLSKKSLVRLLKIATGINEAEKILGKKDLQVSNKEQDFIEKLMRLQENVISHIHLNDEKENSDE